MAPSSASLSRSLNAIGLVLLGARFPSRAPLPDADVRAMGAFPADVDLRRLLMASGPLKPDEQELLVELVKQQARADAAVPSGLPPGSPRQTLAPPLQALLENELAQKRVITAVVAEQAAARRLARQQAAADGTAPSQPPTPRPSKAALPPLSPDGAELDSRSAVVIMTDGLAPGWADRLLWDLAQYVLWP